MTSGKANKSARGAAVVARGVVGRLGIEAVRTESLLCDSWAGRQETIVGTAKSLRSACEAALVILLRAAPYVLETPLRVLISCIITR